MQIIKLVGDGGCNDRWIGLAAKPNRVCDVDPNMVPRPMRSDAGSMRPAKTPKSVTVSDAAAAATTAATPAVDHVNYEHDIGEDLLKEAADIHDDGLSVAHTTEDVDSTPLQL